MERKIAAVYVRVSTDAQTTESQETELHEFVARRGWAYKLYRDSGQSGIKEHRPALDLLISDCRKGKVDVVCVWALDRLARSLQKLLSFVEEFRVSGSISFPTNSKSIPRLHQGDWRTRFWEQ